MIYLLGSKLKRPFRMLVKTQTGKVRPIKWLILLGLVFLLPLMAGLGVTSHATGDAFCQVCLSRILTTLATENIEQITVTTTSWTDIGFGIIRNFLFGFILIAALVYRQPLLRLTKKPHESCEKCGICHKACPMDIHEIWQESGNKAFHEDCTLCGRCAEYCPDDQIIQIKADPIALFSSSRNYYKTRIKQEKPSGDRTAKRKR